MPRAAAPADPKSAQVVARPFLKWAGGKRQLLQRFEGLYPRETVGRFIEPFLGGGAVFFHVHRILLPGAALLFDGNPDLIEAFVQIRDNVDKVIAALEALKARHNKEHFYAVRQRIPRSPITRAARLIYLNKTCFNGLYRVNSKNQFNVPMGRYLSPAIVDPPALRAASLALHGAQLEAADFRAVHDCAREDDFVYFDPPYDPISPTSSFTAYTGHNFGEQDQRDLAEIFRALHQRKCRVMLSNSDTPLIRKLYRGFHISDVSVTRTISQRTDRRGAINELVVRNYR